MAKGTDGKWPLLISIEGKTTEKHKEVAAELFKCAVQAKQPEDHEEMNIFLKALRQRIKSTSNKYN